VYCFQPRKKNFPSPPQSADGTVAYLRQLKISLDEMESDRIGSNVYGLTASSSANAIPGVDAGNVKWEYKTLTAGTGVSISHAAGAITFASTSTLPYRAITALRTLDSTDFQIECTSGTFTVTLPTAVGITGRMYSIKNSGAGVITVACDGAQTIDASATQTLNTYDNMVVMSNGANWIIIL